MKQGHSSISIGYEAGLSSRSGNMIAIGRDSARGVGYHYAGVVIGYQAYRIQVVPTTAVTAVGFVGISDEWVVTISLDTILVMVRLVLLHMVQVNLMLSWNVYFIIYQHEKKYCCR